MYCVVDGDYVMLTNCSDSSCYKDAIIEDDKEVILQDDKDKWKRAMHLEMKSLHEIDTWSLV